MEEDHDRFGLHPGVNQVRIKELVRLAHIVNSDIPVSVIKELMSNEEVISSVVVVSEDHPVGLVMNIHLDRLLSQRYGVSLFTNRPVRLVMDDAPLCIDADISLEEASNMAMAREVKKRYDHLIVVENGKYLGVVSVQMMLNKLSELQSRSFQRLDRLNKLLKEEIQNKKRAEFELRELNRNLERRVEERTAKLVQSNNKLKKAISAAEAANVAKSDFLANMSHELRTPLNHIIGFTDLILGRHFGTLTDEQAEYLNDVLSSSRHLLSLINDILDLSKVEAGKMELDYSDIDIKELLENSLVMIKERALKNGIKLFINIMEIPLSLKADERKIKQIMYNLLSNAVKFTPAGGCIHVNACLYNENLHPLPDEVKDMSLDESMEYLFVSVDDTGIGIKDEDKVRIFNPFEQAENSRNRKYQGTGLGLSLTKKLVENHNGRLWVECSGEGKGSAFRFVIPCGPSIALHPSTDYASCMDAMAS